MPNITPSDVHTPREVQRCRKCRRMNCKHNGVSKHGHKGEPGYELLHPGRGRRASLPAGWTGSSAEGVFHGPDDYRLTYDPQDGKQPWRLDRKEDVKGTKYREVKRYSSPDKAYAGSRGDLRRVKSERRARAAAEAQSAEERATRVRAENENRARRKKLENLPGRKPGARRPNYRSPNPVDESKIPARELPGPADGVSINNAKAVVRAYPESYQRKYAERVARLGAKGIAIDPTKRQEMSEKYGTSVAEMISIEDTVYGVLFPSTMKTKPRRARTFTGVTQPTGVQMKAADDHGGRRITVLHGSIATGRNEGIAFKATKGQHRGKFVMVTGNGSVSPIDDSSYADKVKTSAASDKHQIEWRDNHRWSHAKGTFVTNAQWEHDKKVEQEAIDQANADLKQEKSRRIEEAKKWAKAHGFDPEDSYWWAFYWRDPSLLSAQTDEETDTTEFRAPLKPAAPAKPAEQIPAGELPLGRRKRPIKGWRYGSNIVVAEHRQPKGGKPGDYRVYRGGKQLSEHHFPTKSAALTFLKQWIDWIRNGARIEDMPAGPTKQMHKPTEYGKPQIDEMGNPIPKGTRRQRRVSKARRFVEADHPRAPRGSDKGGEFVKKPWTGLSLSRPPRGGSHRKEFSRQFKPEVHLEPEEAVYLRNHGSTAISDKRLKEIFIDPTVATQQELSLLEIGAKKEHDGTRLIKVPVARSGGVLKGKQRYDLIGQIQSKMSVGSGDRSAQRSGLSENRRETMKVKNRTSGKNSYERERRQMVQDWSLDGKTMTCIFCGKKVMNNDASMETPRPKALKGGYTRDNIFPAHQSCNTKAGKDALRDPVQYYEFMFSEERYFDPKRVSPELRKRLDPIFRRKHRRFFQ